MDTKLIVLQATLADKFGCRVDVFHQEGRGVLVVPHGEPLRPENVIFTMNEFAYKNNLI